VKSELTEDFIECFRKLPERVRRTARKNYKLWKENPYHPGLEFKSVKATKGIYSVVRSKSLPPSYTLKECLGKARHLAGRRSITLNGRSRHLIPR
jgi:hypothetical protein